MSWTTRDMPDQAGRVAVVTGANGGLGLEATRELVRVGATVVMGVRTVAKGEAAADVIRAEIPGARLELRQIDLGSLESVRRFAATVRSDHGAIDILLNNAGIMAAPAQETEDGFESQIGTNHLGHFALTAELMPALEAAPAARVVTVTSFARLQGRSLTAEMTHLRPDYHAWQAYGDSKLANLHFAIELARRLAAVGSPVASLAAHPGLSRTDLQVTTVKGGGAGGMGRVWQIAARWIGMDPARGVLPLLRAATDPEATNGAFYGPRWVSFGAPVKVRVGDGPGSRAAALEMWRVSAAQTGTTFSPASRR